MHESHPISIPMVIDLLCIFLQKMSSETKRYINKNDAANQISKFTSISKSLHTHILTSLFLCVKITTLKAVVMT
jgi:hypothetical protein